MDHKSFKKGLQSEIKAQGYSAKIKSVGTVRLNTVILFEDNINPHNALARWLNTRFMFGVKITGNEVSVNIPYEPAPMLLNHPEQPDLTLEHLEDDVRAVRNVSETFANNKGYAFTVVTVQCLIDKIKSQEKIRKELLSALEELVEACPCKNGCKPSDMTCATQKAKQAIKNAKNLN